MGHSWVDSNQKTTNAECCFSCGYRFPVLDRYVKQREDRMMKAGLLGEVFEIYNYNYVD
jgi:tRNA A37 N6-isopentenylltransferase MiaA